ncbi:MAG: orotidine-5'-phosphate decarboxylase [Idiomarina sp.]
MNSQIFVALDFNNRAAAKALVDQLSPDLCGLKVGKELFAVAGPEFVKELTQQGFRVFLDLKYHDIPNTVAKAVAASAELGVWMVNVHASGGRRMLSAAREALMPYGNKAPKLIAVTVLTSMSDDDLAETGVARSAAEQVLHLAKLSKSCELDGVVCSAQEAEQLKAELGESFMLVTPGIRPAGSGADDQRRTMTPEQAQAAGVDVLVIGRPITAADQPLEALQRIHQSLQH